MANFDWLRRKRRDTPETELPPPAAVNTRADEEDDPTRCPKRWMGKRCALRAGHVGVCRWPA